MEDQNRGINSLENCLKRKKNKIDFLQAEIEAVGTDKIPKTISIQFWLRDGGKNHQQMSSIIKANIE